MAVFVMLLSVAAALLGTGALVTMLLRFQAMSPLTRSAVVGCAFGLFSVSRYLDADHSAHAMVFGLGAGGVIVLAALRQLNAAEPGR